MQSQLAALPGVEPGGARLDDSAARRRIHARHQGRERVRSRRASRRRSPSTARRTPTTSAPRAFRCCKGREFSPTDGATRAARRDHQQDARRSCSSRTRIRSASASRGRATCSSSSACRATGAPWSASSATRRTAGSTPQPLPVMFIPFAQGDFPTGGFVIRAQGDPAALAPAATRIVRGDRPGAADREGADDRSDSRRERRAAPAQRAARRVVRCARADRRGDRHRRRCSRSR